MIIPRRNARPLCGCRDTGTWRKVDEFVVCDGCSETLTPDELVTRATKRTRRAYAVANHLPGDYR